MSTIQNLRLRLKRKIDGLSRPRLELADELIDALEQNERIKATEELMEIPGISARLRRALREADRKPGVNWREVRSDV